MRAERLVRLTSWTPSAKRAAGGTYATIKRARARERTVTRSQDIEPIWLKYFEAERELHWILPPSSESGDS